MHTTSRIILATTLTYLIPAPAAWALTNQEIVTQLEALDDLAAAYPLAHENAIQTNTYTAWRNLAITYATIDLNGTAYLRTWQLAKQANQAAIYRDFMAIHPQAAINLHAIHAIYKLALANGEIAPLLQFIQDFSDTIEAVAAILAIQNLAFARAKQQDEPEIYDAFVATFPGAVQIPQALELAVAAEQRQLETQNAALSNLDAHESLARRVYNAGRKAEKDGNAVLAARKYRLVELDIFADTKVYTEMLDREERKAYERLLTAQQVDIRKSIESMQVAVVDTMKSQTEKLSQTVTAAIQQQTQQLSQTLTTAIQEQTQQLGQSMQQAIQMQGDQLGNLLNAHNRALSEQLSELENQVVMSGSPIGMGRGILKSLLKKGVSGVAEQILGITMRGFLPKVARALGGSKAQKFLLKAIK